MPPVRRAVVLPLPLLALLGGCHALVRDAEVIDYRPGRPAPATVAAEDAGYRMTARGGLQNWVQTDVASGSPVGFRQESDGSVVAFAGEQTWPVDPADGRHVWLATPKPVTGWDRFLVRSRDRCESAATAVMLFVLGPVIVINGCLTGEWP
jgi:hypothetical protein